MSCPEWGNQTQAEETSGHGNIGPIEAKSLGNQQLRAIPNYGPDDCLFLQRPVGRGGASLLDARPRLPAHSGTGL
jgi:hypothetical protein